MRKFLTIMLAAFGLLLLAGCADSPKEVAKNWMTAIVEGDLEAANENSSPNMPMLNGMMISAFSSDAEKKAEALKNIEKFDDAREEIDGDTAKVYVEGDENPITLTKIDGEWKVDVKK